MAQRLVLTAKDGLIPISELNTFVETAIAYGAKTSNATFDYTAKGKELRVSLPLPKDVKVVGKRTMKVKPKTKKQQAVDKQIADHKEKKKNGEVDGYVPPVGRKTPPKQTKIKCPVCNVKKPVVTVAKTKSIKPHVVKGEPCPGGGAQVVKKGRSFVVASAS